MKYLLFTFWLDHMLITCYCSSHSSLLNCLHEKVERVKKVFPYTFIRRGVPVREDTYAEPSACEVGWPVLSSPPLFRQCSHWVPICCWVNNELAFSQGIESGSSRRPSAWEACALSIMLPHLISRESVAQNELSLKLTLIESGFPCLLKILEYCRKR